MMPCDFLTLDGGSSVLDLDSVYDIVNGPSGKRAGWSALIIFDPQSDGFIELRSSPPDVRGASADEAEAVTDGYLADQFNLTVDQLIAVRTRPANWIFLDRRALASGN